MVVADAVVRKLPGALGHDDSAAEESFSAALDGNPEYPHYTRPPEFRGWGVPEVLQSGNHAAIARWRREQALLRTLEKRPDLLAKFDLTPADQKFLAHQQAEREQPPPPPELPQE